MKFVDYDRNLVAASFIEDFASDADDSFWHGSYSPYPLTNHPTHLIRVRMSIVIALSFELFVAGAILGYSDPMILDPYILGVGASHDSQLLKGETGHFFFTISP